MEYELSFNNFDYKKIVSKIKKKGKKLHGFYPFKVTYFLLSGEKNFKKGFAESEMNIQEKLPLPQKS